MKWVYILLAAIGIILLFGLGIANPTAPFDGASRVNVRGIIINHDTAKPVEGAHIEFRFGASEPTNAEGFSGTDGSFVLPLEHWGFYGYEYFFLWNKTYYYEFCMKVSAHGYEERLLVYERMPRDPYYVNADNINAGTVSLSPSPALPAE